MSQPKPLRELSLVKLSFPNQDKLKDLTQFVLNRDAVPHADLEDGLRAISRRFERFPLKGRALDLYTNNRVHLLSNKETVQVPTLLPGWRVGSDRGPMAYVNVTQYTPATGAGQMDVRKLFGFIVLGAVLVDTYESWGKISASMPLAKSGSVVYARMMHKVIDRITGIGMDRMRSDQVKFVLAKYFLIGMMGRPANETTDSIATAATAGSANNALVDFESALGQAAGAASQAELYSKGHLDFIDAQAKAKAKAAGAASQAAGAASQAELYSKGFLDFIDALAKAAPWMARLTARGFVQNFSSMYGPPSLLMAEDAGYFYALMATHQAGAEIISGFSFDPVYGREGDEALDEMTRLVR